MLQKGFTLIELLVVVSIIGLLSSIVFASITSARTRSQIAAAKQQMRSFINAVSIAQGESSKVLKTMSQEGGSSVPNCSMCASCSGDLRNSVGLCYTNWIGVLTGVQNNSSGIVKNLTAMTRDPWGSPYLVDENQGESGLCANVDNIRSVGPDGVLGNPDDVASPIPIPLSATCP